MPSNRTSSSGSFSAEFELAGKQLLYARIIHEEHNEVDFLRARLEAKVPAADGYKRRSAPSIRSPAGDTPASMLPSDDESALSHVRNHGDTLGACEYFLRNTFIRRSHDLVQGHTGCLQAIFRRWLSGLGKCE